MNKRPDHEHVAVECLKHNHNEVVWLKSAMKELRKSDEDVPPELMEDFKSYGDMRKEAAAHLVDLIDGWRSTESPADQAKRAGLTVAGFERMQSIFKSAESKLGVSLTKGGGPMAHTRDSINERYIGPDLSDKELDDIDDDTLQGLMELYRQP